MGEPLRIEENAFLFYLAYSNPNLIEENVRKNIPPQAFEQFSRIPKREFLKKFCEFTKRGVFGGTFVFP